MARYVSAIVALTLAACIATTRSAEVSEAAAAAAGGQANPIRKVVNMLRMMQSKIENERKQTEEIFDKYSCYCKKSDESLQKSISAAEEQIPLLTTSLAEKRAAHTGIQEDLKRHTADRIAAKEAKATATSLRERDAEEFTKESTALKNNIKGLGIATVALEKGIAGGFLQTNVAVTGALRTVTMSIDMSVSDRDLISSFLDQAPDGEYKPKSNEIVGILKQMSDQMKQDLEGVIGMEDSAKGNFQALVAAKKAEIGSSMKAIESKTEREGELAVKITAMSNDLADLEESLESDKQFLTDLSKSCKRKKSDYESYMKTTAEEMLAIADAIEMLNSDDALELLKKTVPGPASFLQVAKSPRGMAKAHKAADLLRKSKAGDPRVDLLALSMRGQKFGIDMLIGKINNLAEMIKNEQQIDDNKKAFCEQQIDTVEDEVKVVKRAASDRETSISDMDDALQTVKSEIEAILASIRSLDAEVGEATLVRKSSHAVNIQSLSADNAALKVLAMAENRLNRFYNPNLHKEAVQDVSEEERIASNFGADEGDLVQVSSEEEGNGVALVQVSSDEESEVKPTGEPEGDISHIRKSRESGGVMALIDLMKRDLRKMITETELSEKDAQEDFENLVNISGEKRALDAKSASDKQGDSASLEEQLHMKKMDLSDKKTELSHIMQELGTLHGTCDWLVNNFDLRTKARADEVDALMKAKAVLSGSDYT